MPPVDEAIINRFGSLAPEVARGPPLRHDRRRSIARATSWARLLAGGIAGDAAFLGEPKTQRLRRWIRTSKEHCFGAEPCDTIDRLRQAVSGFVDHSTTCG
jgi:hypothetical protein